MGTFRAPSRRPGAAAAAEAGGRGAEPGGTAGGGCGAAVGQTKCHSLTLGGFACSGRKITKKGQKDLDLVATTLSAPAAEY